MTKTVSLVHPQQTFQVLEKLLVQKCGLFREDPILVSSPLPVKSKVSQRDFQTFVSALEGASVPITNDNLGGLSRLCEEFQFGALAERLSQFRESDDFKEDVTLKDLEARKRLLALEERMQQSDCEIVALRTELLRHSRAQESASEAVLGRVARLEADLSALHTASGLPHSSVSAQKSHPPSIVPSASVAPTTPASPLSIVPSGSVPQAGVPTSPASAVVIPSGWNSAIVADFPKLFEDFKQKQFTLLWRGTRDGFRCQDFHSRCDGHPNTLTVILDTKGNIFGGLTPVEWESGYKWKGKADPSLKTFVFTLKNPHNLPARRFALRPEQMDQAICCTMKRGPNFYDVGVLDNCNTNTASFTYPFGSHYTNDTGLNGNTFFTGSGRFQVKESEVFEIK
jgi:hypothetical protein